MKVKEKGNRRSKILSVYFYFDVICFDFDEQNTSLFDHFLVLARNRYGCLCVKIFVIFICIIYIFIIFCC